MAGLPAQGYTSNASRTVAEVKVAVDDIRDTAAQMPGGTAREEIVISGGAIVPPDGSGGGWFRVDTEGNAATDDLASITITNCWEGMLIWIGAENASRVVTLKHGTGNLSLEDGADLALTDLETWVQFQLRSTTWVEVDRHSPRCGFHATPSGDQSGVVTGTWTQVLYQTETYDLGGDYTSGVTSTFTAPAAGQYLLTAVVSSTTSITDGTNTGARFVKNGSAIIGGGRESAGGAHTVAINISAVVRLAMGDTVTVEFLHNNGSNLTLDGDGSTAIIPMHFAGHRLA